MSTFTATVPPKSKQSIFQWVGDHWFATFLIVYGAWVFAPFLAPIFMHIGWIGAGNDPDNPDLVVNVLSNWIP